MKRSHSRAAWRSCEAAVDLWPGGEGAGWAGVPETEGAPAGGPPALEGRLGILGEPCAGDFAADPVDTQALASRRSKRSWASIPTKRLNRPRDRHWSKRSTS